MAMALFRIKSTARMYSRVGVLAVLVAVVASQTTCLTDRDCNHAGACSTATNHCVCDHPFHGTFCEQFTLYSYKPGDGGLQMPGGNTTWGGSVVQADDGTHHMYAAMMARNGTLDTWLAQSVVAHAVSKTGPQGPYTFSDVSLGGRGAGHWDGVTCHNPDAKRTPNGPYLSTPTVPCNPCRALKKKRAFDLVCPIPIYLLRHQTTHSLATITYQCGSILEMLRQDAF